MNARSVTEIFADHETHQSARRQSLAIRDGYAALYVAATAVIMAYGGIVGFVSILVFYAFWLPRFHRRGQFLLSPSWDNVTLLMLPAFAVISSLWSGARGITLYTATQYASLIVCAIIMARVVTLNAFLRGMVLGSAIVLIATLIHGKYGYDPMGEGYSLVGLFGSKNQVGLFAELGVFCSLMLGFTRRRRLEKLCLGLIPLGLFLATLYMSKSVTSLLSLAATLAALAIVHAVAKMPRAFRGAVFGVAAAGLAAVIAAAFLLGWDALLLQSFGKDATLTGRTLLWKKGMEAGMEKFWTGYGYSAFWVKGNIPAEYLWNHFRITARSGFHFHNLFIEAFAGLGIVGLSMLAWAMLTSLWRSIACMLRFGMEPECVYALGISVMFWVRALVEVDLIGTFAIGPIVYFSILPRLTALQKEREALSQLRTRHA